jgi:hypothetical protein
MTKAASREQGLSDNLFGARKVDFIIIVVVNDA